MSTRRLPRPRASARARFHAIAARRPGLLARLAVLALLAISGTMPAGATASADTATVSAHAPVAHAAAALPAMGVPFTELLHAVPQLASGSAAASGSSLRHAGAVVAVPADAGSIVQVRPGATVEVHRSPGGPIASPAPISKI